MFNKYSIAGIVTAIVLGYITYETAQNYTLIDILFRPTPTTQMQSPLEKSFFIQHILTISGLTVTANIATILGALAAMWAVVIALPTKPRIEFLEARFAGNAPLGVQVANTTVQHRTCQVGIGFKNNLKRLAIKPKVCVQLPYKFAHLLSSPPNPTNPLVKVSPNIFNPNNQAIIVNEQGLPIVDIRSNLWGQDQKALRLLDEKGLLNIYAEIPFVPPQSTRVIWIRVRIPDSDSPENKIVLHLSVPFLQRERHLSKTYRVTPKPDIEDFEYI